jgi:general secretion pathway protein K
MKRLNKRLFKKAKQADPQNPEKGSATITALIVVGVAAVMLSGLMWRQQIQVRSLENDRDRIQAQWLQRAAIDFARLVLVEDQRNSQIDHLGEAWALPLADGKVADFLKNADVPDEIATVTLRGQLIDAQSQFNLSNLWDKDFKSIHLPGVQEYGRLLDSLGLDKNLAQLTAQGVLQTDMPLVELEGLLRLPAYNLTILEKIRPFTTILPTLTTVNVNTASPELLMAAISGLTRSAASNLVQQRSVAPLKSLDELTGLLNKLGVSQGVTIDASLVDVRSRYWVARSEIMLGRGIFISSALIMRSQTPLASGNLTQVIWSRTGKISAQ